MKDYDLKNFVAVVDGHGGPGQYTSISFKKHKGGSDVGVAFVVA